jgi:DNA-binding transcriptional LysR family regulator
MNLKAIASLVAVVEHGNFSKAALALDCSKAFLSQQVSLLEQQYQTQLLLRTTRKLQLTQAGETFVRQCQSALGTIQQAQEQLLEDQQALSGKIRVASIGGIYGEQVIAPVILKFMDLHPDIEVELDFSSQNVDILNGAYDIAIRFGDLADSTMVARELQRFRPLLVASPHYVEVNGEPQHPNDLSSHRLITGTVKHWTFKKGNERLVIQPKPTFNCGNGHVMLQAAINGCGIAHLPDLYAKDAISAGLLNVIMTPWLEDTNPCNLLYPPSRYRLKRVQAMVGFMQAELEQKA